MTNETNKNKGYHLKDIVKGEYGQISKIIEEYQEYQDAVEQKSKIMMLIELSDMYGAVVGYVNNTTAEDQKPHKIFLQGCANFITREVENLGFSVPDLMIFSKITERAFQSGDRKNGS